jgi:hypothetical protein
MEGRSAKKPGRNEPCPCGSGKKYKRCHLPTERAASETRFLPPPEPFLEDGGVLTGRPFIDALHQGYRFRAVGGRLYYGPVDESFHEFVLRLLREHLTHEWIRSELDKEAPDRHILVNWFLEKDDLFAEQAEDHGEGVRSVAMTGNVKSLLGLGYDVYSLMHTGKILPKLINRLKHHDQFQGARYEMAVAAIVARCGMKLDWLNADDKHCEFVATEKRLGMTMAFEAKSHHRPGILHQPGTPQAFEEMKVKLGDHVRRAIEQAPIDMPFLVFNDLNLPVGLADDDWIAKVEDSIQKSKIMDESERFSLIFATNFSWHFAGPNPPEGSVLLIESAGPKHPVPKELATRLALACSQYGSVPPKIEELGLSPQDFEPDSS